MSASPPAGTAPILDLPITARFASRAFLIRRGLLIGFTFLLHFSLIAAIALSNLLVVEIMKPPRAACRDTLVFHPPGGGGGGKPTPPRNPPADGPKIQPPKPRPVVFALPPPSETNASPVPETISGDPDNAGPRDGIGPGPGEGEGEGRGAGKGDGEDPGVGPGPGGPGVDSDVPYPEGHPDITPPVLIASSRAYPRYPDIARKAGVQASVILLVVIDTAGRVGEIEVLKAPDPRYGFDLACIEAVKQWRYHPALLAGRPVAVQASLTFEFSLSR